MQEGNKALEAPKEEGLSKDLTNTGGRPGMVRFFMNIGRSQKISVQDIVRTIAIEADIPAKFTINLRLLKCRKTLPKKCLA